MMIKTYHLLRVRHFVLSCGSPASRYLMLNAHCALQGVMRVTTLKQMKPKTGCACVCVDGAVIPAH